MTSVSPDMVAELQQENARLLAELRAANVRQNATAEIFATMDSSAEDAHLQTRMDVLTRQLKEARAQQTATAEVLEVINSSSGNLTLVFDAILARAHRVCGVAYGSLQIYDGERFRAVAVHDLPEQFADLLRRGVRGSDYPVGRALLAGDRLVHVTDCSAIDDPVMQSAVQLAGIRTALFLPLRRDEALLGMIVCGRREIKLFTDNEIALLEGFAVQAAIAMENARLLTEARDALERQTATADILKVIASVPADVQPVFEAIATRANALLGGFSTAVFRFIDGIGHLAAFTPTNPAADAILKKSFPRPIADFETFAIAQAGKVVQTSDIETLTNEIKHIARARGFRSMMFVPLVGSGGVIGMISVTRKEAGHFVEHHVQLLQTFANQAVIALENARLFNQVQQRTSDLTEALQQQTAIGEVLKIISRSTFDLQPVLDTLVRTVARLCDTEMAFIMRREGNVYRAGAAVGYTKDYIEFLQGHPIAPDRGTITGRAVLEKRPVQILDVSTDPEYTLRESTTLAGQHTALCVPLLREGEPIGTIVLARQRVEPFTEKQIELVTTFADQAVIAIENIRLFDELRQRTDDLSESLQQQTATADVLKVISRSTFDLPNVLNTLVSSAARLCGDPRAAIYLIRDGLLQLEAAHNNSAEWIALRRSQPVAPSPDTPSGRAALSGQIDHVPDLLKDADFKRHDLASLGDYRATLNVPLIREGITIGVLSLARPEPGPFTRRQIEIVQTFADQAVIAIENVRLFEQLQAKTRDLTEALTYQTGSANILRVIAASPTDVSPVLRAIVESACELCEAADAVALLRVGDEVVFGAQHGSIPMSWQRLPVDRRLPSGRAIVDCKPVHVHDLLGADGEEYSIGHELARRSNVRTILSVPLVREDESIGAIVLRRAEVNPFNEKQIGLLQTFADQAVIAIGNVRLFEEVQDRTRELTESLEQQTATAEVLETISASAGELDPVFNKMLENAIRICGAQFGTMNLHEEGGFRTVALYNAPQAYVATRLYKSIRPHPASGLGTVEKTHVAVHIDDIRTQAPYIEGNPNVRALADLAGARTLLVVPMLKESELVGTITIFRQEVKPFTEKQTELVANFANQAVIAIENARLLSELRERTNELSQSLEDLRAAQDRLIQTEKLASLGQLTAGIAHEIKNPLNFVNNFASLSAELTDELNDVLRPLELPEETRDEIEDLTKTLRANLDKVVQHGKRADSIVKNMLLHSREGSGEYRLVDLNALVEESLNLAYHGARAETPTFNVTLKRDFDPEAGTVEVFPQEITRVLLNLVSNGFYAVRKRAAEVGASFRPEVIASTRSSGDHVEIRIRDNGTGIPPELQEKIFNPFFTTKPAGDGTGLGLSMSHDIIVKQHGGTIHVDTEPGVFTEFIVTLPRASSRRQPGRSEN